MAKITLISEFADSATWSLAQALHNQKQDVLLVTSASEMSDRVPTFPVMTPFKKWSVLEALRILPRLIQYNPEVIHFVFSQGQSQIRAAHWLLAPALAALPNKAMAISSFSEVNLRRRSDLYFFKFFGLMTFGTRTHLMSIKRSLKDPPLSEVIPPFELNERVDGGRVREDLEKIAAKLGPFILFPQAPPNLEVVEALKASGFECLVLSEKFKFNTAYFTTGPLSPTERNFLIKSCTAIWLAGLNLSVQELRSYQEQAQNLQRPMLVSPDQNETLPGLCWNLKSGWVLDQGLASLKALLHSCPNLQLVGNFENFSSGEMLDSSLNELLRLYSRAMRYP